MVSDLGTTHILTFQFLNIQGKEKEEYLRILSI